MKQAVKGSLLISVVVLITVMGLISASIAYMMTNNAHSISNQGISTQAFYLAQAGLEVGMAAVATQPFSSRVACETINGGAAYTNVALGAGTFTVTGTSYFPTPSSLSVGMTSVSTVIPMSSVALYAPAGSVVIQNEIIDYGSVGTSSAQCGSGVSACLLGLTRGANGSVAAAHVSGLAVSQMLCELTATAGVPSVASPKASRTIKRAVMFARPQTAGAVSSGELIQYWSGASWVRFSPSSLIGDLPLNGMDLIDSSDGWAVGNINTSACTSTSNAVFIRFNGATWSPVCSTSGSSTGVDQSLNAVSCSGSSFCKAVGSTNASIASWNGSSWTRDATTSMPSVTYNAVDCPSSSLCFAVGNALNSGTSTSRYEVIIQWNGSAWTRVNSGVIADGGTLSDTVSLLGIDCPSTSYCIAVGTSRTIVQYNGSWSLMTTSSLPNVQYNKVSCVSSSDCWAVGHANGGNAVFVHWNGSTWTRVIGSGVPAQNMLNVKCSSTDACWAVGASGAAAFWNGSVWASASSGNPAVSINAVSALIGPQWKERVFAWREVFN